MIGWRGVDVFGDRFADLAEVREAGGETSGAAVYNETTGAITLTPVPVVPWGTPTVSTWTDSGSFVGGSSYDDTATVTVNGGSTQAVVVSIECTGQTGGSGEPWQVYAYDTTSTGGTARIVGGISAGAFYAHAVVLSINPTGSDRTHSIPFSVSAPTVSSGVTFSVTATVHTVYYA